jgi:hypothetical protein
MAKCMCSLNWIAFVFLTLKLFPVTFKYFLSDWHKVLRTLFIWFPKISPLKTYMRLNNLSQSDLVSPARYRSNNALQALLVEKDIRSPTVFQHYCRHKRPLNSTTEPDSFLTFKNQNQSEFEHAWVWCKWFEVNDLNQSATDIPRHNMIIKQHTKIF